MDDKKTEFFAYLASDEFQEHKGNVPDLPVETLLEVLSILPIGVALYTPDQRMWAWNKIAAEVSNLPAEVTFPGIPLVDILKAHAARGDYGEGDMDQLVAERLAAVYDNSIPNRELKLPNSHVGEYGSQVLSDGTMVAFVQDITERRRQEDEILARQRELENLNKQKDELFAIIAHDLRSPLTAVVGFSEMIENMSEEDIDQEKAKAWAQNVGVGARGLAELVDNLLSWARLQMDDHQFAPGNFDLSIALKQARDPLRSVARKKNISHIDQSTHVNVSADLNMIRTVLRNLINNGIKFVDPGGTVTTGCRDLGNGKVEIFVSDTGVGMSEKIVAKLLDGARNQTTPGTENETGTGLGLRICHSFLATHNSSLKISSDVGKGSTFSFLLDKA
ncbi:MAG: hypothetical protein HOE62_21215 [Alphaproteobacteria bacterium]|nr:hypothetical protein [Alphaproteobacteria bacterium]MBT4020485.1 hypothetical protein [Alphaproteobacteria bacterium]MBT4964994.1 hypothetical protein [Alphaproteobacteria bacterium]MBT5158248.1 hypothetical protein [Alphaproteobacteria bacterium]